MLLFLVAYLGGVLTILSPCILPVLPFVFARANRSFLRSSLPLLIGMAATFAAVATLAAVGGGWAVQANQAGRWAAMILLAFFGLTLLLPRLADRAMQPLVRLGAFLSSKADQGQERIGSSLLLGIATGLLWAPCAGPILGLILTGAALNGASVGTSVLLLAYALGAATSLALALLVGGRVFAAMKRSIGAGEWVRRALGLLVLAGVGAIALGLDTTYLARLSSAQTEAIEHGLARRLGMDMPGTTEISEGPSGRLNLPVEGGLPPLDGITDWLNSQPLTRESLRGQVVLIDFWTYSCINCLRSIPYVRAWDERYRDDGLVVIGVHAPEFAFERDLGNVRGAVADLGILYPVAVDNNYALWRALRNRFWPAHYFIDHQGRIRYHHFGEGDYDTLGTRDPPAARGGGPDANGRHRAGRDAGRGRAGGARDPAFARDLSRLRPGRRISSRQAGWCTTGANDYRAGPMALNQWSLAGDWTVQRQHSAAQPRRRQDRLPLPRARPPSRPRQRQRAAGPLSGAASTAGRPAKPREWTPTRAARAASPTSGSTSWSGSAATMVERLFEIEFLDPGVEAFAFTFG